MTLKYQRVILACLAFPCRLESSPKQRLEDGNMGVRIGIGSGGTFTDVMAVGEEGQIHTLKVPSTPEDPASFAVASAI